MFFSIVVYHRVVEDSSLCSTFIIVHPTYNSLHLLNQTQSSLPSPTPQSSLSKLLPTLHSYSSQLTILPPDAPRRIEVNGEAPIQLPSSSIYSPSSFLTYLPFTSTVTLPRLSEDTLFPSMVKTSSCDFPPVSSALLESCFISFYKSLSSLWSSLSIMRTDILNVL